MTKVAPDSNTVCEMLDKLVLQSLHLMEEKLEREVALEAGLSEGSFHLAKSRYIMGQSSVCSLRLPTESSVEFSASAVCDSEERDGVVHLQSRDNNDQDTVNPIKWFGLLVPQNLHRAQRIFRGSLDCIVDCANVHVRLSDALNKIQLLRGAKANSVMCE